MSSPQPDRIADLASYFRKLARDVNVQGRIAKIDGNVVQVVAVALLSGGIALAETMAGDIATLAGNAKERAIAARPVFEQMAGAAVARGASRLLDKFFGRK